MASTTPLRIPAGAPPLPIVDVQFHCPPARRAATSLPLRRRIAAAPPDTSPPAELAATALRRLPCPSSTRSSTARRGVPTHHRGVRSARAVEQGPSHTGVAMERDVMVSDPAAVGSSSSAVSFAETRVICRVCQKQFAQYTYPHCNSRYCLLPCYKTPTMCLANCRSGSGSL